jgi:hypothetical protein
MGGRGHYHREKRRPMKSRLCLNCCGYHLHRRARVRAGAWGRWCNSFPPPHAFSQLIPVVIEQRRLCIGLLVPPPWGNYPHSTDCGSVEVKATRFYTCFLRVWKAGNNVGRAYIIYIDEEEKSARKTDRKSAKDGSCWPMENQYLTLLSDVVECGTPTSKHFTG